MNRSPSLGQESALSQCRKALFAIIALSLIIFLIYGNSFDCSWHLDDEPNITDNPNLHLKRITWEGLKQVAFSNHNNPSMPYRPVACVSLALNYYFGGLKVFGFHLVNILIHILSSIFLYFFIHETLRLPALNREYGSRSHSISLLASVFWAINPVQTQAVTYIVQRMAALAALFYVLSMLFYVKARTSEGTKNRLLLYFLCFVAFLMALGSKENAAILPVTLFFYEVFILRPGSKLTSRKNFIAFMILVGAILILGVSYLYFRGGILSFLDGYKDSAFTLGQRLLTESRVLLFYISLLLYPMPTRLSIAHSVQISNSPFDPISTFFSILFLFASAVAAILLRKKSPLLSFSVIFFLVNHLIESSILPLELIFEHRNYLPSMLFFLPFAIGLIKLLEHYSGKIHMRVAICGFIVLILASLGHSTFVRNFSWKNEKSLWLDAVKKAPDQSRTHHNLGKYFQDHGYYGEAIQQYQKALESPFVNRRYETFVTYYNLGKIYARKKDYTMAEFLYDRAVWIKPDFPPIYNDIAALLDREGKYQLAQEYLEKAIQLSPHDALANFNLGFHYLKQGEPKKAIVYLNRLSGDERPFGVRLPLYLGIAYKKTGRLGRAAISFRKALKRNPKNIKAHLHLAEVYELAGMREIATREVATAVDLALVGGSDLLKKIFRDLEGNTRLSNLQPNPEVLAPLIRRALAKKTQSLAQWTQFLENHRERRVKEGKGSQVPH